MIKGKVFTFGGCPIFVHLAYNRVMHYLFLKLGIFIYVLGLLLVGGSFAYSGSIPVIEISSDELAQLLASQQHVELVDVRAPTEYSREHIPGAINVPLEKLQSVSLSPSLPKIVYCGSSQCPISVLAARKLEDFGHTNVKVLTGGFELWKSKKYKTDGIIQANTITTSRFKSILPDKAVQYLNSSSYKFVDLRASDAFNAGHIVTAVNIPLEDIKNKMSGLDKNTTLIVYDSLLPRVKSGMAILVSNGYVVAELSGGMSVWIALHYPITSEKTK